MQTIQNRFDFKKRLNLVDLDSFNIGTERLAVEVRRCYIICS